MNNLSWLIYLSDVVESLKPFLIFVSFVTGSAGFVCTAVYVGVSIEGEVHAARILKKIAISGWSFCIITSLLAVPVPSQKTILMIAASESAEALVTTPEGVTVRKIINDKLNSLIQEGVKK